MIDQLEIRREAIGEVCRRYGVASLSVFGSAVDGSFDDERSDLDFLVTFDPAARMSRFEAFSASRKHSRTSSTVLSI